MPSSPGIGMHVEVKDPDDKVVLSRVIKTNVLFYCVLLTSYIITGVQLRRQIYFHLTHTRRTCHLLVFQ